jgi:Flp pilus assembly protein TadD
MFERASEARPEDYEAAALLALVYAGLGRAADAQAAARRAVEKIERHLEFYPYDARALCMGAGVLPRLGDTARAQAWAKRALSIDPEEPAILYNVCCTYALVGKIDEALDCLERCAGVGFFNTLWVEHDTDLDPLRGHPRYQAILALVRRLEAHQAHC